MGLRRNDVVAVVIVVLFVVLALIAWAIYVLYQRISFSERSSKDEEEGSDG